VGSISASELLKLYHQPDFSPLDLRAEVEYTLAALPMAVNIPILNNQERHQVGICYKENGQDAAIALGQKLVAPYREQRIQLWREHLKKQETPILYCWRGGLRSRTAWQWLNQSDYRIVAGGYKAVRRLLLEALRPPQYGISIIGKTGVAKTRFIQEFPRNHIDWEKIANHRGSAFGNLGTQPSQGNFENSAALAFYLKQDLPVLLEDESRCIGRNFIPGKLYSALKSLPAIHITATVEERSAHIYQEYVCQSSTQELLQPLEKIVKKLGHERKTKVEKLILAASQSPANEQASRHQEWISLLLREYYDPLYQFAMDRYERKVLFTGSYQEAKSFLQHHWRNF
jgi:tRNA 2-selenouridine synthase